MATIATIDALPYTFCRTQTAQLLPKNQKIWPAVSTVFQITSSLIQYSALLIENGIRNQCFSSFSV